MEEFCRLRSGLILMYKTVIGYLDWPFWKRKMCKIFYCIHLNPLNLNPLYLREDSCKIGGCCSFVEIDVLHCIVLHYIVSSYVSIIVSTIGKTVVKLGFAVPLRCMPRCHAAACSICPWLWDSLRTNGFVYFWDFFCEIRFCISV